MLEISKEEFFKILDYKKDQEELINKLDDLGLPLWDSILIEYGYIMFDMVIKAYFTIEGVDWITWWLYEKNENPELKAWDEYHNEIPMETREDFWQFIKQYRKSYMTKQAQNSLSLYKGQNPSTIKQALSFQKSNVVNELKEYFNAKDLNELSIKLSIG